MPPAESWFTSRANLDSLDAARAVVFPARRRDIHQPRVAPAGSIRPATPDAGTPDSILFSTFEPDGMLDDGTFGGDGER
jgi:hypothetical protein